MSEEYRRIVLTFWTDPEIKRPLTRDQKLLLLYFCTSPHSNMIGLYYCPLAYAANESDIPIEEVRKHVNGPLARFVTYDEQTEEVFVHALAKHNLGDELTIGVGRNGEPKPDHRITAVKKLLDAVHSTRLKRAFLLKYGAAYALAMPLPDEREAPSEPLASPYPSPSEAITKHNITEHSSSSVEQSSPGTGLALVPVNGKNGHSGAMTATEVRGRLDQFFAAVADEGLEKMRAEERRRGLAHFVFSYWVAKMGHPRALLDDKRERLLVARLKENDEDVGELLYVVDGAMKDPWTMGTDPQSTKRFDGIETIYQSRSHVEKFAGLCKACRDGKPHPMAVKHLSIVEVA